MLCGRVQCFLFPFVLTWYCHRLLRVSAAASLTDPPGEVVKGVGIPPTPTSLKLRLPRSARQPAESSNLRQLIFSLGCFFYSPA